MYASVLKNTYPRVYEAAFLNYCQSKQVDIDNTARVIFDETDIDHAFTWSNTVEGEEFWHLVWVGRLEEASGLAPVYFKGDVYENSRS